MSPQTVANFCVRCETRFTQWTTYHAHVVGIPCARVIRPVNTSGRSKGQIVDAWELKNQGAIIQ